MMYQCGSTGTNRKNAIYIFLKICSFQENRFYRTPFCMSYQKEYTGMMKKKKLKISKNSKRFFFVTLF